ncbi:MAG: RICIN domain-containing protein [Oscillospiraceae bacterium]|nr:RICIN domain-containing protein [Oscillospiraceae bacterium]
MKSIKQRILSTLLACSLAMPGMTAGMLSDSTLTVSAASNWKFDFGGGNVSSGYTGVSASDGYNAGKGYGFANTGAVSNVNAGGSGAGSDAVSFNNDDIGNTFNVDLPKGLYQVTITTGNAPRCSIKMEGMLQIINVTGLNATETVQIPVTDGQLNIQAVTGMANREHSISAVEITQLNDTGVMNPHIWICGDSTVANYYNCADTSQHGWGQFLGDYLKGTAAEGYVIRNMAASGQYAKGFVDGGQFDCIESYGKSGDYYIISIGINDTNYSNADEYTQVVTDMVQRAKKKGMEVILVKQQGRRSDLNRDKLLSGRWFGGQMDAIGTAENVKVVDLFNPWQDFGLSVGFDGMADYYAIQANGSNDDLHQSKMGSVKLAELVSGLIFTASAEDGALLEGEPEYFMLRNGNSGQYLSLASAPQNGTNVVQLAAPGIDSGYAVWKAVPADDGYFYIYNIADDSKLLDVDYGKADNGTNIGVWENTASDAQLYKFLKQDNGSYVIATKASGDKSAVEVKNASDENGENVQEWERNGHACQTWFLDRVTFSAGDVIPGDMNGDGVVDVFDEALLKREVQKETHTHADRRAADLNGDAVLDVEDVKIMNSFVLGTGNITCVSEGKQVYYAIDQAYNKGYYENTNAGFTSEAYVNLDNNNSSFIEFSVTVPSAGNYLCTFNIANGSAVNRQMKVQVNDNVDYWMQDFLSTEAWTNWNERALVLPLVAGVNMIRLTSATNEGGPNIDYLRTEWTDEPIAETYVEPEPEPEPEPSKTTIYIAGDSTVQSYRASYAPQQGWGYYLGEHFSDNVTVSNHAIAGRSSKSFYDNGRLQTILDAIQPGDYLMVQFAINDSAASNAERHAPVCGNVDNPTEGSYEWYMTQYIKGAQEKGATPILVTTVIGLGAYANNTFNNSYGNYCNACKQLAAKYNCPCIDLNTLMVNHYNTVGYDTAYTYHMISAGNGSTDKTHFTETGASVVAGLVADAVKGLKLPISTEVK